jgi:hypothetical protein
MGKTPPPSAPPLKGEAVEMLRERLVKGGLRITSLF